MVFPAEDPKSSADARQLAASIDEQIEARLAFEGLRRAPQTDDAEFIRRAVLDLHGVVPSPERTARFLDSRDPEKRVRLIDELLASPRFGKYLGDIWRRRLVSPAASEQRSHSDRFANWLAHRFNHNDGWDKIVYDLLTADGTIEDNPVVVYLIMGRYPLPVTDLTDLVSRYFLGIRLNCAQCHDHPSGQWTRKDYWGLAAFFAQIQTPGRPKRVHLVGVQDNRQLTLSSLLDTDVVDGFLSRPPTFLGGQPMPADDERTNRVALAAWITSSANPYFSRAAVNRMWWHFFGRGIVNPVDDMHADAPVSHPELLDLISRRFIESGFDLKFICRAILTSRTYQQTSRPGDWPERESELFARVTIKALSPEQLYDSLVEILGPQAPAGAGDARSGARNEFVQFFADDGDPDPTRYGRGIPHLLRLMNSPQFAGRSISDLVARIARPHRTTDQVVADLFLTILSRRPSAEDRELVSDHLRQIDAPNAREYRELAWALLMSSEFALNH
jgi:hypothetical protein